MRIPGAYADIVPRVLSGVVLAGLGLAATLLGGWWFRAAVFVVIAAIAWELGRMLAPSLPARAAQLGGVLAGAAVVAAAALPAPWGALVVVPAVLALAVPAPHRRPVAAYLALACYGGLGFLALREGLGVAWLLWFVLVVIGSDVAGYVAGRALGGPKLWPRVSPKKTWSGTLAGWAAAVLLGLAFMVPLGQGPGLVLLSLAVCIAGQAGDIAESALKRRVGVKDSSQLIPGHGGVMDRFDAMLGAAAAFQLAAALGLVASG